MCTPWRQKILEFWWPDTNQERQCPESKTAVQTAHRVGRRSTFYLSWLNSGRAVLIELPLTSGESGELAEAASSKKKWLSGQQVSSESQHRNYQVTTEVLGRLGCGAEWDITQLPMAFCDLRCQSNFLLCGHFLLKHTKEEQREKKLHSSFSKYTLEVSKQSNVLWQYSEYW